LAGTRFSRVAEDRTILAARARNVTDTELRALCHRFFDAIERGDCGAVAQIYAPEFRMWVNLHRHGRAVRKRTSRYCETVRSCIGGARTTTVS
jgi:hypothetical protein